MRLEFLKGAKPPLLQSACGIVCGKLVSDAASMPDVVAREAARHASLRTEHRFAIVKQRHVTRLIM